LRKNASEDTGFGQRQERKEKKRERKRGVRQFLVDFLITINENFQRIC
jgi:hypothetical protein